MRSPTESTNSRLDQVETVDGPGEDAGPVAAGAVADDGELEVGGVVVEPQVRPRVAALDRHAQVRRGVGLGRPLAAGPPGGAGEQADDEEPQEPSIHLTPSTGAGPPPGVRTIARGPCKSGEVP